MPIEGVMCSSRSSTDERLRHRLQDLGRDVGGVRGALDLRQHHDELVAAHAADGVHHAQLLDQPLGDFLEHQVARRVAERVVDVLEAVQVDEHRPRSACGCAGCAASACVSRSSSSRRLGSPVSAIVVGEVLRARLRLPAVGDLGLQALVGRLQLHGALGDRALERVARSLERLASPRAPR